MPSAQTRTSAPNLSLMKLPTYDMEEVTEGAWHQCAWEGSSKLGGELKAVIWQ